MCFRSWRKALYRLLDVIFNRPFNHVGIGGAGMMKSRDYGWWFDVLAFYMTSGLHDEWFRGSDHHRVFERLSDIGCICLWETWNNYERRVRDVSVHDSLHQDVKQRPSEIVVKSQICSFCLTPFLLNDTIFWFGEETWAKATPERENTLFPRKFWSLCLF